MKGIQYLVDDAGNKTAVVLDLAEWGALWEDILDILVSETRQDEPAIPWETLKAEMGASAMSSNGSIDHYLPALFLKSSQVTRPTGYNFTYGKTGLKLLPDLISSHQAVKVR